MAKFYLASTEPYYVCIIIALAHHAKNPNESREK